jgi:hypothetical protein
MRELAREELKELESRLTESEDKLKFLLIPKELITSWISMRNFLPPALINSAGIWSVPGDCEFLSFQ